MCKTCIVVACLFSGCGKFDILKHRRLVYFFPGISILRGYGFVQYESEEEARAAVASENNVMVKGQRLGKTPEVKDVFYIVKFHSL